MESSSTTSGISVKMDPKEEHMSTQNCSQISIREFLNFLKTAYQKRRGSALPPESVRRQRCWATVVRAGLLDVLAAAGKKVQDTLEGVLSAGGMHEAVDWLKLKDNQLVKAKELEEQQGNDKYQNGKVRAKKSRNVSDGSGEQTGDIGSRRSDSSSSDSDPIKRKLSEVLSEGLLDSVLPFLVPSSGQTSRKSSLGKLPPVADKSSHSSQSATNTTKKKNSDVTVCSSKVSLLSKEESEVEIHVCDEVKNMKKDFCCNQKLLVEKMGYFAEVTSGQRLEDMDISVHCDIGIFEWLMKWVKKDSVLEEDWPQLDPQCVVPILVSAAFLQMEPLQHDCLLYCHEHMSEILKTSTNLSCLNDSILTRLAAMYTNSEVEAIKDRKDKIQSRIFTKLILSLAEPEPESVRGHWCSLAQVYKCAKCQQSISPAVGIKIPCVPSAMQLQCDGSIVSRHVRDTSWNINEYILKLHKSLKTWRKVYWRLWGDAHFLYCEACKRYFPAHQIGWCRHHPDPPQYFTLDAQKAPLPVGRYPCCGERAYRFQLLQDYSGCQFREHTVRTKDVRDSSILSMLETYRSLIEEEPPQLMFPERLTRLVARDPCAGDSKLVCKENFWWEGFQVVPPRPKLGLLNGFCNRGGSTVPSAAAAKSSPTPLPPPEEPNVSAASDHSSSNSSSSNSSSDSSSSSEGSAESNPPPKPTKAQIRRKRTKRGIRLWQPNLSARSNQDLQRAYEEHAIKEMTALLNRRTASQESVQRMSRGFSRNVTPMGGLWVRLESEWRDNYCVQPNQSKNRSIFTGKAVRMGGASHQQVRGLKPPQQQ